MRFLIGDPTVLGWTVTLAYLLAAASSGVRARRSVAVTRARLLWSSLAAITAFLAVNKQLDLQVWLDRVGRRVVRELGWYPYRWWIQLGFFVAVACLVVAGLVVLARLTRPWSPSEQPALAGAAVLGLHLVVRAAAWDLYDVRGWIGGWNVFPTLELTGSALVAAAAFAGFRSSLPVGEP